MTAGVTSQVLAAIYGGRSGPLLPFLASRNAAASSIAMPAGYASGDLLVYFDSAYNNTSSAITSVTPTGFTNVADVAVSSGTIRGRLMVSYKISNGAEGTVTGMNSGSELKTVTAFRPSAAISTVTPSTWATQYTTGDPTAQTPSPAGDTHTVVLFGFGTNKDGGGDSPVSWATQSPAFDASISQGFTGEIATIVGYSVYDSDSPQNHTVDISGSGDISGLTTGYLAVV